MSKNNKKATRAASKAATKVSKAATKAAIKKFRIISIVLKKNLSEKALATKLTTAREAISEDHCVRVYFKFPKKNPKLAKKQTQVLNDFIKSLKTVAHLYAKPKLNKNRIFSGFILPLNITNKQLNKRIEYRIKSLEKKGGIFSLAIMFSTMFQ